MVLTVPNDVGTTAGGERARVGTDRRDYEQPKDSGTRSRHTRPDPVGPRHTERAAQQSPREGSSVLWCTAFVRRHVVLLRCDMPTCCSICSHDSSSMTRSSFVSADDEYLRACARACVCVCVRACVRACLCVRAACVRLLASCGLGGPVVRLCVWSLAGLFFPLVWQEWLVGLVSPPRTRQSTIER